MLGKPMGNGHPVAAVITRRPIVDALIEAEGVFFSTFGGNPVSCAAAHAVLDVLEDEEVTTDYTLLKTRVHRCKSVLICYIYCTQPLQYAGFQELCSTMHVKRRLHSFILLRFSCGLHGINRCCLGPSPRVKHSEKQSLLPPCRVSRA